MSPRNGEPEDERGSREGRSRGHQKAGGSRGGSGGEDYRRRRDRNNLAVKRSRVRSKLRTLETLERVRTLKAENEALEDRIQALGRELGFLKDLFIAHAGSTTAVNLNDVDLEALLRENPDDDLLKPVAARDDGGRSSIEHEEDFKDEDDLDFEEQLRENQDDDSLKPAGAKEVGGRSSKGHRRDFKAESPGDGDAEDSEPPGPW